MSSAAALPSVKLPKLSLQERANIQATPQSNDRKTTANIILLFWHFWVGENMLGEDKVWHSGKQGGFSSFGLLFFP